MAGLASAGGDAQAPAEPAGDDMPGGPKEPARRPRHVTLDRPFNRIHGTSEPWSIGHAVSSGCIRMRNEDVIDLYHPGGGRNARDRLVIGAKDLRSMCPNCGNTPPESPFHHRFGPTCRSISFMRASRLDADPALPAGSRLHHDDSPPRPAAPSLSGREEGSEDRTVYGLGYAATPTINELDSTLTGEQLPPELSAAPKWTFKNDEAPGTLVIDTKEHFLYLVLPNGRAMRYGVGVGKEGFGWKGAVRVGSKQECPAGSRRGDDRARTRQGTMIPDMMEAARAIRSAHARSISTRREGHAVRNPRHGRTEIHRPQRVVRLHPHGQSSTSSISTNAYRSMRRWSSADLDRGSPTRRNKDPLPPGGGFFSFGAGRRSRQSSSRRRR